MNSPMVSIPSTNIVAIVFRVNPAVQANLLMYAERQMPMVCAHRALYELSAPLTMKVLFVLVLIEF